MLAMCGHLEVRINLQSWLKNIINCPKKKKKKYKVDGRPKKMQSNNSKTIVLTAISGSS